MVYGIHVITMQAVEGEKNKMVYWSIFEFGRSPSRAGLPSECINHRKIIILMSY